MNYASLNQYNEVMHYANRQVLQCPYVYDEYYDEEVMDDVPLEYSNYVINCPVKADFFDPIVETTAFAVVTFIISNNRSLQIVLNSHHLDKPIKAGLFWINQEDMVDEFLPVFSQNDFKKTLIQKTLKKNIEINTLISYIKKKRLAFVICTEEYPTGLIGGVPNIISEW